MTFLFAEGSPSRFGLKESKIINQALSLFSQACPLNKSVSFFHMLGFYYAFKPQRVTDIPTDAK